MNNPPLVSVIIPFHGPTGQLEQCLDALTASQRRPDEIILIDDASPIQLSPDLVARVDKTARHERRAGPGAGRNTGAAMARGDILFFIDADVLVHPDTIGRGVATLVERTDAAAMIGSYDDEPAERNFFSQFKNLLHHYVHQKSNAEASSFWGACGAIRKDVFDAMQGFDVLRYTAACIEDIDLGYRMKARGHRIVLDPRVQVKHLKRWTFFGMLHADILLRAVPWADLILERGGMINDLNIRVADRVSAACCGLALAALFLAIRWPALLFVVAALVVANVVLNRNLYSFFLRKRGVWFAVRAVAAHMLYLIYSAVTFALRAIRFHARGGARGVNAPKGA